MAYNKVAIVKSTLSQVVRFIFSLRCRFFSLFQAKSYEVLDTASAGGMQGIAKSGSLRDSPVMRTVTQVPQQACTSSQHPISSVLGAELAV